MLKEMKKLRVLFLCVENAGRSQMAEAFARIHGGEDLEAQSAGSRPSGVISSKAIVAMRGRGYDLSGHRSKSVDEIQGPFEAIVTMGCGDACPAVQARRRIDWDIPDPKGMDQAGVDALRDLIEQKVMARLTSLACTLSVLQDIETEVELERCREFSEAGTRNFNGLDAEAGASRRLRGGAITVADLLSSRAVPQSAR